MSLLRFRATLASALLSTFFAESLAAAPSSKSTDDKEIRASAPERPSEMPLALLPEPPKLELKAPRPAALEAIDGLLGKISGADEGERRKARDELVEAKPDWTSGLSRRIDTIVERADKERMKALLEALRKKNKSSDEGRTDYLELSLGNANPSSQPWRDLTQILAIGRMLSAIGSAEAMGQLVRIYARYGEFLRIETQHNLDALGERKIAGYLEATLHQAPKISSWAKKQLDLLGKKSASELVRVEDPRALAMILVALGRTKDPESARVLISYASSERSQLRLAARQGIALLGEVAAWQLRDAYQDATGRTPAREWTWKRTARELFTELDRLRLARVFSLFDQGRKKEAEGALEEMGALYDEVLTESPLFEEREKLVSGYLALAEKLEDSAPERAILILRKVERLASDEVVRNRAESKRHVLEARALEKKGIVDQGLADKAIALDPESGDARALFGSVLSDDGNRSRYVLAGLAGGLALGFALYATLTSWRRRRDAHRINEREVPSDSRVPADFEAEEISLPHHEREEAQSVVSAEPSEETSPPAKAVAPESDEPIAPDDLAPESEDSSARDRIADPKNDE